jgi:hypothetical protein
MTIYATLSDLSTDLMQRLERCGVNFDTRLNCVGVLMVAHLRGVPLEDLEEDRLWRLILTALECVRDDEDYEAAVSAVELEHLFMQLEAAPKRPRTKVDWAKEGF